MSDQNNQNASVEKTTSTTSPKANKMDAKKGRTLPALDIRQPLAEGETFSRNFVTDEPNKRVIANYTLKLSENDKRKFGYSTEFDFSMCTMTEILELAAVTVRIWQQGNIRAAGKRSENDALSVAKWKYLNVKTDYIDATAQQVDETTRMLRLMMRNLGITEEQAKAMVAKAPQPGSK